MATIKTIHIFSLLIFLIILNSTANGAGNVLYGGETLKAGGFISYNNYALKCQVHCNLVLYEGGEAIWISNEASNDRRCNCSMQVDGNLVVYDEQDGAVVWYSDSWEGTGDYVLILQPDRNVVIYGYKSPRWSTKTNKKQNIASLNTGGGAVSNSHSTGVGVSPTSEKCPLVNSAGATE